MLIMNLRVTVAMTELKAALQLELSGVGESIANMRADNAERSSAPYQSIMSTIGSDYAKAKETERMHGENRDHLTRIDSRLNVIEERLPSA